VYLYKTVRVDGVPKSIYGGNSPHNKCTNITRDRRNKP